MITTSGEKRSNWFKFRAWYYVHIKGWPAWRVRYTNGEITRLLGKREASSLVQVFDGQLFIDWQTMYRWMDSW
jgi:hypothetical protein